MNDVQYRLWLSTVYGLGPQGIAGLFDRFKTPEQIYNATNFSGVAGLTAHAAAGLYNKNMQRVHKIIQDCNNNNIKIATKENPFYPARLRDENWPLLLYYKGDLACLDNTFTVCVVGTRKATEQGMAHALAFGRQLAAGGGVVISGMAAGIDTQAHIGALDFGGKTVAVLGHGLDICFPKSNQSLMTEIEQNGAVISIFPPGTPGKSHHFPIRNRIVSALSAAALVVEAPVSSGALITANIALDAGKQVYVLPGAPDHPNYAGSNQLLVEGARAVLKGSDILKAYTQLFNVCPEAADESIKQSEKREKAQKKQEKYQGLDRNMLSVLQAVEPAPVCVDQIIEATGETLSVVLSSITMLEAFGFIKAIPGGRYQAVD